MSTIYVACLGFKTNIKVQDHAENEDGVEQVPLADEPHFQLIKMQYCNIYCLLLVD
jgi:hypothetical protein